MIGETPTSRSVRPPGSAVASRWFNMTYCAGASYASTMFPTG
ncbi:hypothetical protein [Amycolatopsis sp. NPDC051061]